MQIKIPKIDESTVKGYFCLIIKNDSDGINGSWCNSYENLTPEEIMVGIISSLKHLGLWYPFLGVCSDVIEIDASIRAESKNSLKH